MRNPVAVSKTTYFQHFMINEQTMTKNKHFFHHNDQHPNAPSNVPNGGGHWLSTSHSLFTPLSDSDGIEQCSRVLEVLVA